MLKKRNTLIAAAIGAGLSAWTVCKYLRSKNEAIQQLRENSLLLHTALGPIEAAIIGEGPAVLVLHGAERQDKRSYQYQDTSLIHQIFSFYSLRPIIKIIRLIVLIGIVIRVIQY